MPSNVRHLPPRGHYLAHEVGWLAGVSGRTIGQWARRGYIRSSQSAEQPRVYSFQDVAEAMLVHELLERGVSHADIKRTVNSLRTMYGHDWPLTHAKLATAVGRVVAEPEGPIAYDVGRRGWQQTYVDNETLERIAGLLERGGWAARAFPDLKHIEVNPDRLSGRPVIRGKRVPAQVVAQIAESPGGRETLAKGYDVTDDEIEDALSWWRAAREFESVAA